MIEHEQIRREVEWIADEAPGAWARRVRSHCLALLAELERVERERDKARADLHAIVASRGAR